MLYRCGENAAIKFILLKNRDTVINLRESRKEEEKEQEELGRGGRWGKRRGAGEQTGMESLSQTEGEEEIGEAGEADGPSPSEQGR